MMPDGILDGLQRNALDKAGIPRSLARGQRGLYLHGLLTGLSPAEATTQAGVKNENVRAWRHRSDAFKQAERRLRGEDVEIVPDARDERIEQLRARYEAAYAICRNLGTTPVPGTAQHRQHYIGSYDTARQTVQEVVAELRRLGITEPMPIPDEREDYPRQPRRVRPLVDTSNWLWPTSLNPHLQRGPR